VRLGELLGALSLATDLAAGIPLETSLRTCVLATRLARLVGITELGEVRSATLLRHLGCTAFAHEAARLGGDDHDLLTTYSGVDRGRRTAIVGRTMTHLAREAPLGRRLAAVARVMTNPGAGAALVSAQCTQAVALAEDLQLPDGVTAALGQMYERHDGRGGPHQIAGDAIRASAQILHLAELVEVHHRRQGAQGRDAAIAEVRRRRGKHIAPAVADAFPQDAAAAALATEAREGRLCRRAVDAVLGSAGLPKPERSLPAGLTAREVVVLIHLARGSTNKEIATSLGIAVRTANHHIENIYAKLDVTTRAAAAVFAVRHDLVSAQP
jgi:DNA-binding CsgD family transcriptional regulator